MDIKATLLAHYFPVTYQRTQWTQAEALKHFLTKDEGALKTYMNLRASDVSCWLTWASIPDYTTLPTKVALYKNWYGAWTLHIDIDDMSGGATTKEYTIDYLFREMQHLMEPYWKNLTIPITDQWDLFVSYCDNPSSFNKQMSDYWVTGRVDMLSEDCMFEEIKLY